MLTSEQKARQDWLNEMQVLAELLDELYELGDHVEDAITGIGRNVTTEEDREAVLAELLNELYEFGDHVEDAITGTARRGPRGGHGGRQ